MKYYILDKTDDSIFRFYKRYILNGDIASTLSQKKYNKICLNTLLECKKVNLNKELIRAGFVPKFKIIPYESKW